MVRNYKAVNFWHFIQFSVQLNRTLLFCAVQLTVDIALYFHEYFGICPETETNMLLFTQFFVRLYFSKQEKYEKAKLRCKKKNRRRWLLDLFMRQLIVVHETCGCLLSIPGFFPVMSFLLFGCPLTLLMDFFCIFFLLHQLSLVLSLA